MSASYTNLAFEGAGVRNIAQVGALRGMMETAFDFDDPPCYTPHTSPGEGPASEPDPQTLGFHFDPLLENNDLSWDAPVQFLTEIIDTSHQPSYHAIASAPHIRKRTSGNEQSPSIPAALRRPNSI